MSACLPIVPSLAPTFHEIFAILQIETDNLNLFWVIKEISYEDSSDHAADGGEHY